MKKVLTTIAIVLTLTLVLALDSEMSYAAGREGGGAPAGEIRPPVDQNSSGGQFGQGGVEGDPDDLGGGFRSTYGPPKNNVKELPPPLTPFERLLFGARLYWMSLVAGR